MKAIAKKSADYFFTYFGFIIGTFLMAISIEFFLYPNKLIDGGIIGISLICARLSTDALLPYYLIILNLPFIYLAYRYIRKSFLIQMGIAVILFAFFLSILRFIPHFFTADPLEAIVIGGAILGAGAGLVIRYGGCTDGTEILAIILNRKTGYTVGQLVLAANIFIFALYGVLFLDWHIALKSLMMYIVAFKMMDFVIAGLEELKSVMIVSAKPDQIRNRIMNELGLGLTILKGRGGFSLEDRDILFIIVERLDLAELKELVTLEDPTAFMAIETLHEVAYGRQRGHIAPKKKRRPTKKKGIKESGSTVNF
jgi:uncharacterized membrane-anchored protein YitT (DUF2179 family)